MVFGKIELFGDIADNVKRLCDAVPKDNETEY